MTVIREMEYVYQRVNALETEVAREMRNLVEARAVAGSEYVGTEDSAIAIIVACVRPEYNATDEILSVAFPQSTVTDFSERLTCPVGLPLGQQPLSGSN